jgi:hypothetical protein
MTTKFTRKSLAYCVPGLFLQLGSAGATAALNYRNVPSEDVAALLHVVYYGGTILLIIGLAEYADDKGRNRMWAAFGAVSLSGLAILIYLDDKSKDRLP